MALTTISIRMDEDLKSQFERFCTEAGFSVSAAFNGFARAAVQTRHIPFDLSAEKELNREGWVVPKGEENDPFWSEANLCVLNKSIRQLEEGRGVEHELIEE
jgi:DNA-damage-inducible protein J